MKITHSIWRPFLYIIVFSTAVLAISNYCFYKMFSRFYMEQSVKELAIRAKLFNREIHDIPLLGPNKPYIDSLAREFGAVSNSRVTIMNTLGYIMGDTLDLPYHSRNYPARPELNAWCEDEIRTDIRKSTISDENTLFVAVPLYVEGEFRGVGRASRHISEIERMQAVMAKSIVLFNIVALLFLTITSYLISRNYSLPLSYISQKARTLGKGEFATRVKPPKVAELKVLADSFNYMAETVQARMQTITRQRNNLDVVINSMTDALIAVDSGGVVADINPAAVGWLGLSRETAHGAKFNDCMPFPAFRLFVNECLQKQTPMAKDIAITDDDGQKCIVRVKCSPMFGTEDQEGGCVVVFYDVTEIMLAEQMQRDFVSNVSHEIRTPLAVIQGSVEALNASHLLETHREQRFVDNIQSHSLRLNNLVDDLLLLSRIEQNPWEFKPEMTVLKPLISSAVSAVAAKHDIQRVSVNCATGIELNINPQLLETALINLIDNALKYSPNDKPVEISVESTAHEYHIHVCDYGEGIPFKLRDRVFERFYRMDEGRSRQQGGIGLGLAIVKHIAAVHKGCVTMDSVINKGSTITLSLPRTA